MLALLLQRNFFLLWMAHTISILGDYMFFMAITFWMYQQTGSAPITGLLLIASTIPALLFAPLAGKVVDYWDRRGIMFMAESARAALFLGLLGSLIAQPHMLWPIYLVGFLQSALAAFFWPARGASLLEMIKPSALLAANALYTLSDSGVRIIAPSLANLALLRLGAPGVVIIDILSFVISAGSVCLLASPAGHSFKAFFAPNMKHSPHTKEPPVADTFIQNEQRTVTRFHTSFHVRGLFFLGSSAAYIAGTLTILFPIFIQTSFSAESLAYGWMLTAQAIGEGIMSLILGRTPPQKGQVKVTGLISGCLAVQGLTLILLAYQHTLAPGLLLNLIYGAMVAGVSIQILTNLQQQVSNHLLGHVMTRYAAFQAFAQVSGMCLVSVTVGHFGVVSLLVCDGTLLLLASSFAWVLLAKSTGKQRS